MREWCGLALLVSACQTMPPPCDVPPGARVELSKAEVSRDLSDAARMAELMTMQPNVGESGFDGFAITEVRADSWLRRAGLCPGDVVLELAGVRLDDPRSAMRAHHAAESKDDLTITVRRSGEEHTVEIMLR